MTFTTPKLILASSSPRRRELLQQAEYDFVVMPPADDREELPRPHESAPNYVQRLARGKAEQTAARLNEGLVLACDTVAACEGEFLSKPFDRDDARRMLDLLSGREHVVYTGLCLLDAASRRWKSDYEATRLYMDRLTPSQVEAYLAGGQWQGKAGAFGYQDGPDWLHVVEGSESNVVGLPLELLSRMLESALKESR